MSSEIKNLKTNKFAFLLVPGYSMTAFTSAIEPLSLANRIADENLFHWDVYTIDGLPVRSSSGLEIVPKSSIDDLAEDISICFICGGVNIFSYWNNRFEAVLHELNSRENFVIGAMYTASYLLACAGLLDGYHCTVHADCLASLRDRFPRIQLSDCLYKIDRNRITCSGGYSSLEMMLEIIKIRHGSVFTKQFSELSLQEKNIPRRSRLLSPLRLFSEKHQTMLTEVVTLMEANVEELLSIEDLSRLVGISSRQLERQFKKLLKCTPSQYYSYLRLDRARMLIQQTERLITDISLDCGYASSAHFSKSYRQMFGIRPRDERRKSNYTFHSGMDSIFIY